MKTNLQLAQFLAFFLVIISACSKKMETVQKMDRELSYKEQIIAYQQELNSTYSDKNTSILSDKQRKAFTSIGGHPFYPINEKYKIEAAFEVFDNPELMEIKTSSEKIAEYYKYGKAEFYLDGQKISLLLLKSVRIYPGYENHLFLAFTDLSSGEETYGGGRYIYLEMPEDKTKITIDFNKSFQPYCAYTTGYSCPIPPKENFIDHKVIAGIKHLEFDKTK